MARAKRGPEQEVPEELDNVHASRKKRVKYSEEDAQLAQIYNDLADEVQAVRIKAAGTLLNNLSAKLPDTSERVDVAETRLIRGLCSNRKAARLGFSIALVEVFRLRFSATSHGQKIKLSTTLERIINSTEAEGRASGQEKREHLLGRRFAFQALLQSDVGLNKHLPDTEWKGFIRAIFSLAGQKQWLRRECGVMLFEYLSSAKRSELGDSRVQHVVDILIETDQAKTPEGVGLWLHIQASFPNIDMPGGIWHKKDPLSPKDRLTLTKIMLASGINEEPQTNGAASKKSTQGTRESIPTFAWRVILHRLSVQEDGMNFRDFWKSVVAESMFTPASSTERKALGLQVFQLAVKEMPLHLIRDWIQPSIIRCIIDQRADPERYLFDAAKVALNEVVARAIREPESGQFLVYDLLESGGANFDQLTKSKTIETILSHAQGDCLLGQIEAISRFVDQPGRFKDRPAKDDHTQAEIRRRMVADLLLSTVRSHSGHNQFLAESKSDKHQRRYLQSWTIEMVRILVRSAYGSSSSVDPPITDASRVIFRARLMSLLNIFLNQPIDVAIIGLCTVADHVNACDALRHLRNDEKVGRTLRQAEQVRDTLARRSDELDGPRKAATQAFQLLFALATVQVYSQELDSLAALEDLITCYETQGESSDSTTILVELLLSFISKPSAIFRRLAEQVFSAFAAEITAESLQSLVDILGQKESLTGQQELFDQNDGEEETGEIGDDDESALDVEDASDVELANGHQVGSAESGSDEDDDGDSGSSSSSEAEEGVSTGDDEEAAFDKKLAEALGTVGEEGDSDDDGSDMDDDQMMALEPHLTSIFKEKKKTTSKKQDKKDARENIVNFKNRVLDLLMIYIKSQYTSTLALDLIHPLTVLMRTTTSKPASEKAFNVLKSYFEACTKNKSLPQPEDHDATFELLTAVHEEMKLGGSKLHANACSRSSLFLSKVLVAMDQKHYHTIADMYSKLQSDWYLDPKSKVHGSVFTEWTSWSISTRKQIQ